MSTKQTPKYEITNTTKVLNGRTYHRIRALRDFELLDGFVKKGTLGGYVQKRKHPVLSQQGSCWIESESYVWGSAVRGSAFVTGMSKIEDSTVDGNVTVRASKLISSTLETKFKTNTIRVKGSTLYNTTIKVGFDQPVYVTDSYVRSSHIVGPATLHWSDLDECTVREGSNCVVQSSNLRGTILRHSEIYESTINYEGALVSARIKKNDFLLQGPAVSSARYTLAYKNKSDEVIITTGCFEGNIEKFEKEIKDTHTGSPSAYNQYMAFAETIRKTFNLQRIVNVDLKPMRPQSEKRMNVRHHLTGLNWQKSCALSLNFFWLTRDKKKINVVQALAWKDKKTNVKKNEWFELSPHGLIPMKEPK